MATLTVSQTKTYVRTVLPVGIDLIDFTNTFAAATATFSASQADGSPIRLDTQIDGSAAANHLVIGGGGIDASQWSFNNWSVTSDSITLNGSALDDTLTGSSQRDTVNGLEGDDTLTGGSGADSLNGGAGNDAIVYGQANQLAAGEAINGGGGSKDKIRLDGGISYDFRTASVSAIEVLDFSAAAVVHMDGSAIGAGAISSVRGHSGLNWLELHGSSIDLTGVTFTNWTDGSDILRLNAQAGVVSTLIGGAQSEIIAGSSAADTLTGKGGNDDLYGFGGADNLAGGAGDDTFFYSAGSNTAAGESVNGGNGLDTIQLQSNSGTYQLRFMAITGIEALTFSNLGSQVVITGNQLGRGGIASIIAGSDHDYLEIQGSVNLSKVDFDGWGATDDIFIVGDFQIDDVIVGSDFGDIIEGDSGDDIIEGGAGADSLAGQIGEDTVSYAGSLLEVTVDLATGTASGGHAAGDSISGFEGIIGGKGGDTLTGSDAANSIAGGAGDDVIIGGLGADALSGGSGDDTFVYREEDDLEGIETINGGAGIDTITFDITVDTFFSFIDANVSGFDRLVFTDSEELVFKAGVFGSGPGQIDKVVGSANANSLTIFGPNTDLSGVSFSNWLGIFGGDSVRIIGDLNDDTIVGSDVTDQIGGLNGSDSIDGGGNADILAGGLGQDFLTGGAGADFFTFEAVNDSATGASRDRILDFDQGSDTVTLSAIDAIAGGAGDMFVFIGELGFNVGEAGRLRYFHNGQGNTIVQGEVNGDGIADFSIQINGTVNLASADFEL